MLPAHAGIIPRTGSLPRAPRVRVCLFRQAARCYSALSPIATPYATRWGFLLRYQGQRTIWPKRYDSLALCLLNELEMNSFASASDRFGFSDTSITMAVTPCL